jgi:tetratricopeptide (TPR) repeat protein
MTDCRAILALLLFSVAARAEPRQLSRQERAVFKAAIADAHKADKKGDHAACAAAYQRALALQPDDGRLLSDLGWQLFLAKDLPRAEEVTRKAIGAGVGRLRAASNYNLGKILEAKGDKSGAVKAYVASLEERPNLTVMTTLARLDPAAASAADPMRPRPMEGPYPSLEAFCDARGKKGREDCPADPFLGGDKPTLKPGGPRRDARVFVSEGDRRLCHFAVRTERGWFVRPTPSTAPWRSRVSTRGASSRSASWWAASRPSSRCAPA